MSDERRDEVERVLSAIGRGPVPEGLEARVLSRLARQPALVEFHWREVFRPSAVAGVWWRGAVSGAAVALLVLGVAVATQHAMRRGGRMGEAGVASHAGAHSGLVSYAPGASTEAGAPCATPGAARTPWSVERLGVKRIELVQRPLPGAEPPLTAEERQLVRLAQHGDPRQLDVLIPEVRAKVEAEDTAQFESFFAPPPPLPPQPGDTPAVPAQGPNE
jgi:hypothetical protein